MDARKYPQRVEPLRQGQVEMAALGRIQRGGQRVARNLQCRGAHRDQHHRAQHQRIIGQPHHQPQHHAAQRHRHQCPANGLKRARPAHKPQHRQRQRAADDQHHPLRSHRLGEIQRIDHPQSRHQGANHRSRQPQNGKQQIHQRKGCLAGPHIGGRGRQIGLRQRRGGSGGVHRVNLAACANMARG